MKRVLVTGGSGTVGRFIVKDLLAHGYDVTIAGRNAPPPDLFSRETGFIPLLLDPKTRFEEVVGGYDLLVHAAIQHVPGRYRGGEGDDVAGFWSSNFLSTLLLFRAAAEAGLSRGVFLSSRAVYGAQPPGVEVFEHTECHPDTHYGAIKHACERHLTRLSETTDLHIANLRATGVYGITHAGGGLKWSGYIADYLSGDSVEPRCGTEVHGNDLATAVRLMLEAGDDQIADQTFNVSDLFLDQRDIMAIVRRHTGCAHPLPAAADKSRYNVANTDKLSALGWKPGGMASLDTEIARLFDHKSL
ncbi:MAG: NAD(P)-dependent oxidoreductase [Hyphomicrobiales bacterium]|nr:NAD(P)-dependent oxidoreductase [Hyphomicrobiales bacterium]MCP5000975.1 NAD(P)-dependent oxidoreductase [Hyphomicrobiales bacterium]